MKHNLLFILIVFFLSSMVYAQKDTVDVPGYYSTTTYGTLNEAVDAARENGTISNTVFKLEPYEVYVLSRSIFLDLLNNFTTWTDNGTDQLLRNHHHK